MNLKVIQNKEYNAKFNGLYNQDSDVYTQEGDKKDSPGKLERSIQGEEKGSNGSDLKFDKTIKCTFIKLHIYDLKKTIRIDIREFLKEKYQGTRFTKKFFDEIKGKIPKEIKVICINNVWNIVDYKIL